MLNVSANLSIRGDGKLYYCGALLSADRGGFWKMHAGDYVDLTQSEGSLKADKLRILRYCLGDVDQKFISMCNVCWGAGPDNPYEVVAGVQIVTRETRHKKEEEAEIQC